MPGTKDEKLGQMAELQAGAVTNAQLRGGGMSAKDIKVRRRRGSFRATSARGVYVVAGSERSWRQDLWVALLAGPKGTLASHVSAAALPGLIAPPSIPQVTVPRDASGRFQGAVVHHAVVTDLDRDVREGIATTALGQGASGRHTSCGRSATGVCLGRCASTTSTTSMVSGSRSSILPGRPGGFCSSMTAAPPTVRAAGTSTLAGRPTSNGSGGG